MSEFDSIRHLDFPVPSELVVASGDYARFESLEVERLQLLEIFSRHKQDLDNKYGTLDPANLEDYGDRLLELEALMRADMASFNLDRGDFIQVKVPNLVYPIGYVAEFDAGESVRARFENIVIHPHYGVNDGGQLDQTIKFGLNLSVSEPVTVSPTGIENIEMLGDMNPLVSLHHESVDLQRVILWD